MISPDQIPDFAPEGPGAHHFEAPRPIGPPIPCEVCKAPPGRPCRHGIRALRSAYRIPEGVSFRGIGLVAPAECWLLYVSSQFFGRIERPKHVALWRLYNSAGVCLQACEHPRFFDYSKVGIHA